MTDRLSLSRAAPRTVPQVLRTAKGSMVSLFLVSAVSNLLMLTGSIYMLQVYDRVLASRSIPTLVAISLLVMAVYTLYAFLEWIRMRMAVRFAGLVDEAMAADLFKASVYQKLVAGNAPAGDPVRELDTVRQFVSGPGLISFLDLPWMPVYMAVVFLMHPYLGWLTVGGAGVMLLLLMLNEWSARSLTMAASQIGTRRQMQSEDARANAESIVAMGMMGAVAARWSRTAGELVDYQRFAADKSAFYSSTTRAFRFALQSAVLGLGAYLVIGNEVSPGSIVAASILTSRALAPLEMVVANWRGFLAARQSAVRMRDALKATNSLTRATELPLPTRTLSINNLATGPLAGRPTIVGATFTAEAGDGIGIVGPSGSGKSSLARALVGVWPVLQGDVRLDGAELAHYGQERIGQAIGYLPQSVELFDGSVAENIARFRPNATTEQIIAAAKAANVHDLISSLPDGYDTRIGERGAVLSAGQRQRVGLARALFGDPFLVVLDEPNSNLDPDGDNSLTEAITKARRRGAIVLVVAHRPSAIAALDKLVFLRNGRQGAFGPKDEVLKRINQPANNVVTVNRVGNA